MIKNIIKIFSVFLFLIFFYLNINFYIKNYSKSSLQDKNLKQEVLLKKYGMNLEKIKTDENFKNFIDNSEYFKKKEKQPTFWELLK